MFEKTYWVLRRDDNQNGYCAERTKMSSALKRCSYKLIVLGDSSVGKTSIINRFCDESFDFSLTSTIGIDFKNKQMPFKGHQVALQIWDTAGQERYWNMTKSYFKKAQGVIIVFSLTDHSSFKNVEKWLRMLENEVGQGIARVLVGSKFDMSEQRTVSSEEANIVAVKYNIPYLEISSKLGYNIAQAFQLVVDSIICRQSSQQLKSEHLRFRLPFIKKEQGRCGC